MIKQALTILYCCLHIALSCTNKNENINYSLLKIQYDKEYRKFDSIIIDKDSIDGSKFGIKADYNGKMGTDNRKSLQIAIDFCSKNNKILILPKGRILLNSYGISQAAITHGNIIELRSNTKIFGIGSEIIIGSFFHDKNFIVFSGINNVSLDKLTEMENITFNSINIDFNSVNSYMSSKYLLRKGIEFGNTKNGIVTGSVFKNGDLSCAIATGHGNDDISRNINIYNNKFINLIKSEKNEDHTSVYINSQFSKVYNNRFINESVYGKLVACATELHNSNTEFFNNTVNGYTRMMFLAAVESENHYLTNLFIHHNKASITNAAIYLWLEKGTTINNILIEDNMITSNHIKGYSMAQNGTQGILADSKDDHDTKITNMTLKNNIINITNTAFSGRAVKYATKYKFEDINNSCLNCRDGDYYKD